MQRRVSKYYYISLEKEIADSYRLAELIRKDEWMDDNTIIVNCSPDYSSITSQIVNHRLSIDNSHELYEQLYLEMPYPTMNQVWNRDSWEWEKWDKYLQIWFTQIDKDNKYLFLDSGVIRGQNFSKLRVFARGLDYKLASLYVEEKALVTPDYKVEVFSSAEQGGLLFEWENPLNPNWNY